VFVYVVLKNQFQEKWTEVALQIADEEKSTIAATAAKRVALVRWVKPNDDAYHGGGTSLVIVTDDID
jgi:hypothetical protein